MTTSSPTNMSVSEGYGVMRSRNAQAQADLRARRKTYISELEIKNANLSQVNEKLQHDSDYFEKQIGLLKGQVRTLKESLGMRKTAASSVDSLLAAVEVERSKVRRLRSSIRKIALLEAQDSDSDQEEPIHNRKRTRISPSPCADLGPSTELKQDSESIATLTTSSLSPPTPTQLDPMCSQWANTKPQPFEEEEQESSRSALTLLLAQSSSFKRKVVDVLAQDLQGITPEPLTSWNQWQPSLTNTKVHDEILERFLSSISTPSESTRPSNDHTTTLLRPSRGHFSSASIFLVLFLLLRLFGEGCREGKRDIIKGKSLLLRC